MKKRPYSFYVFSMANMLYIRLCLNNNRLSASDKVMLDMSTGNTYTVYDLNQIVFN